MLKIFFTVDVEIWCNGWNDLDQQFPSAFQRYIHGRTRNGFYGLPLTLQVLNDFGLTGVFFVEPLFSLRHGLAPLSEITGMIMEAKQPIELHLHTEWLDEAISPIFPEIIEKRQHLRHFSLNEQIKLIKTGKQLLSHAGVNLISAFRAGSFGFNIDTLAALKQNGIFVDSSYNATAMGLDSGLLPGQLITEPVLYKGIYEAPMTVFFDRPGHLRHTQLCACSSRELEGILWQALHEGRQEVVILSHSVEFLDSSRTRPNHTVINRFQNLCQFLDKNSDCFTTQGFENFSCNPTFIQPTPLSSPLWKTGMRTIEQVLSKFHIAV